MTVSLRPALALVFVLILGAPGPNSNAQTPIEVCPSLLVERKNSDVLIVGSGFTAETVCEVAGKQVASTMLSSRLLGASIPGAPAGTHAVKTTTGSITGAGTIECVELSLFQPAVLLRCLKGEIPLLVQDGLLAPAGLGDAIARRLGLAAGAVEAGNFAQARGILGSVIHSFAAPTVNAALSARAQGILGQVINILFQLRLTIDAITRAKAEEVNRIRKAAREAEQRVKADPNATDDEKEKRITKIWNLAKAGEVLICRFKDLAILAVKRIERQPDRLTVAVQQVLAEMRDVSNKAVIQGFTDIKKSSTFQVTLSDVKAVTRSNYTLKVTASPGPAKAALKFLPGSGTVMYIFVNMLRAKGNQAFRKLRPVTVQDVTEDLDIVLLPRRVGYDRSAIEAERRVTLNILVVFTVAGKRIPDGATDRDIDTLVLKRPDLEKLRNEERD